MANGESIETKESQTITGLLRELDIEEKVMGVALNSVIVKKEKWDSHLLKEGDRLEFLSFVGGG